MTQGTDPGARVERAARWAGTLNTEISRLVHEAVAQALAEAELERPAPLPVAVSIEGAARLISVSADTVRTLIENGTLRTLDLGGVKRTLVPTLALLELDPEYRAALAEMAALKQRVEELEQRREVSA